MLLLHVYDLLVTQYTTQHSTIQNYPSSHMTTVHYCVATCKPILLLLLTYHVYIGIAMVYPHSKTDILHFHFQFQVDFTIQGEECVKNNQYNVVM